MWMIFKSEIYFRLTIPDSCPREETGANDDNITLRDWMDDS